jgi:hypothetical protein
MDELEFTPEELANILAQNAELKKAIGNLWKKVDELKTSLATDIEYLSKQISEWTQTNLQLMKLLTAKTEETERLAQNSSKLIATLDELKKPLRELELPTTTSSNSSENLPVLAKVSESLSLLNEANNSLALLTETFLMMDVRDIPGIENRSIGEIFSLACEPKKRPKLQPQEAREKLINDLAKQIMEELKTFLSEKKASPRTQKPIPNPQNPEPKTSTWSFELASTTAILIVCFVGFSLMSGFVGWQIRYWQIQANADFQLGQQILEWNRSVLEKARQQGKPKTTLWLVPPESESSKTTLEKSKD